MSSADAGPLSEGLGEQLALRYDNGQSRAALSDARPWSPGGCPQASAHRRPRPQSPIRARLGDAKVGEPRAQHAAPLVPGEEDVS